MEEFVKRIIEEKSQLDEKINKLEKFLTSDKILTIDTVHASMLWNQLTFMKSYSTVLNNRLTWIEAGIELKK